MYTFHNPFNATNLSFERIENPINHLKVNTPDKQWIESVRIAWSVAPSLAIFLSIRFPNEIIINEVRRLVKSQPERVVHIPQASIYLGTEQNILNDSIELE